MSSAPMMTAGLILFNVFIFILISAFAMDDIAIGRTNNMYESVNESGGGLPADISESGFMGNFITILFSLPWWLDVFVWYANFALLGIVIFAWVRGL